MTFANPPADRVHPMLKFAYLHMKVEDVAMTDVARGVGISYTHLYRAMQGKSAISLQNMEAVLNYLGYSMKATPAADGAVAMPQFVRERA